MINIAIDGPSGAGKSTVAKSVASMFGYIYIDTGAMYRTVGLYMLRNHIDIKNQPEAVISLLPDIKIDLKYIDGVQHIFLNDEDVSDLIRTPEISMAASDVGAIMKVRENMTAIQRRMAKKYNCIMDGRDIGTFVLPEADVKIFLTADVSARAKRRYDELIKKGSTVTFEEVLSDMITRDKNDSSRDCMPLKQAPDAILIDTTSMSLEEETEAVINCIRDRIK